MIETKKLFKFLKKERIEFFTGVPDSVLKTASSFLEPKKEKHFITTNEGSSIAMAIGYYLATKKIPCVYMQNSGLGNAINPLISISHKKVYSIPMLMIIGWRGAPGIKDEPQHNVKGKITKNEIEEKIKKNFTRCWQYFFDYQIPLITRWKVIFGDVETWTIWGNCVYNQNLVMSKNLKDNQNLLRNNDAFIKRLNDHGNQGLNAMTISELTSIPRPTVLRKLKNLLKKKLLTKDKNNHYLIFGGPGTSNYSKDILKIMSDVDEVRKINGKEFAELITKILNVIVL